MNIQTVAENLRVTIAGKEQMLAQYRTMTLVLRQDESPEIYATVKFLEINIDELKRILQDVEQCIPKSEYSLDGPMIKMFRED
jgi:hypothetical protein